MKITNPNANIVNQAYTMPTQRNQNQVSGKEKAVRQQNNIDSVSLSSGTKDLQKVFTAMDTEPDKRADRVAELKAEVDQGTYTVDAEKVAGKMAGYFLNELG